MNATDRTAIENGLAIIDAYATASRESTDRAITRVVPTVDDATIVRESRVSAWLNSRRLPLGM